MLLLVHLELLWKWCLNCSLELLNLVTIMLSVIKNLPLLDSSLVHLDLASSYLFTSDLLLSNELKLILDHPHASIRLHSCVVTVHLQHLNLVVVMIDVIVGWLEIGGVIGNIGSSFLTGFPDL